MNEGRAFECEVRGHTVSGLVVHNPSSSLVDYDVAMYLDSHQYKFKLVMCGLAKVPLYSCNSFVDLDNISQPVVAMVGSRYPAKDAFEYVLFKITEYHEKEYPDDSDRR